MSASKLPRSSNPKAPRRKTASKSRKTSGAQKRFQALVENSAIAITLLDANGVAIYDSPAAPGMLGYGPDDWIGRKVFELLHPEDAARVIGEFQALAQDASQPVHSVFRIRHSSGDWLWIDAHGVNLLADPDVGAIVVNYRDITERVQANEAMRGREEYLDRLMNTLPDAVLTVNFPSRLIYFVNKATTDIFGYSAEELIGQTTAMLYPDEGSFLAFGENLRRGLEAGQDSILQEVEMQRKDGTRFWASTIVTFRSRGDLPADAISVVRDITESKLAAQERERTNAMLRERVKELTTLRSASQILQEQQHSPLAVIQEITRLLPAGWQYPEITAARIHYDGLESATPNFRPTPWSLQADFVTSDRKAGQIEVVYLEEKPDEVEGPFLAEECDLINTVAEMLRTFMDRHQAETRIHRHFGHLTALHTIDASITSTLDLITNFNVLLEQAKIQLDVDAADILLLSKDGERLEVAAGIGFKEPQPASIPMEGNLAGDVVRKQGTLWVQKGLAHRQDQRTPNWVSEDFTAYYASSLVAKGRVRGVMEVFSRKPLTPDDEWLTFLETLTDQAAMAVDNYELFEGLQHSNIELARSYDVTLEGWARALDLRDKETEGHTRRVTELTLKLAHAMGLPESEMIHIHRGALLHDIGKLGVPDSILLKPEALTEDEWRVMRMHPVYAFEWLAPIDVLRPALDIPYAHHEKWDGTGYPRGLKGEEIPLSARIFAVVDVWDALRSDRPYRLALSHQEAEAYIRDNAGSHFDPAVVDAFLTILDT